MTAPVTKLLYRVSEAAEVLSIGRTQLYELMKSGVLEYVTVGERDRRIPAAALSRYVETLRERATESPVAPAADRRRAG